MVSLLKTAFWLGLVLTAMPLGEPPKMSTILSSEQQAAACTAASEAIVARVGSAAVAYRGLAAMGCASFVKAASKTAAAPTPPSVKAPPLPADLRALTENDRKPPWLGPTPPTERRREG